jgi:hypothetical protein
LNCGEHHDSPRALIVEFRRIRSSSSVEFVSGPVLALCGKNENHMSPFRTIQLAVLLLSIVVLLPAHAEDSKLESGYVSLFNGHDLTGWGDRTNSFDGKIQSDDGRYSAKDGVLSVHPRTPRLVQKLWTTRQFPKNFVLKLEFRAGINADSGLFIRKPQLQVRDYLVAGPYKLLKKYKPQDWNKIEVIVKGGVAHCTCNGEVLEDALKLPPTGPIGLEADRGQMEYRHLRIKELP